MNKKAIWFLAGFVLSGVAYFSIASTTAPLAISPTAAAELKIGIVNFKDCIEKSKIGQQEQARFEEMKKQLETLLEEKEKRLNEMASKFKDEYVDTLTPEAEAKLKEEFKNLSQEVAQYQNQYYQMLNQANYQIVGKLSELIGAAADKVAQAKGLDLVLNTEACFYSAAKYNLSKDVVQELDMRFVEESKKVAVQQEQAVAPEKK